MSQIREQQLAQDNGEWASLPEAQRRENESGLRQISMLARFHNMMGAESIEILSLLTSKIIFIFTHSVMSDRIAAMLNYFLQHLVRFIPKNLFNFWMDSYNLYYHLFVTHKPLQVPRKH